MGMFSDLHKQNIEDQRKQAPLPPDPAVQAPPPSPPVPPITVDQTRAPAETKEERRKGGKEGTREEGKEEILLRNDDGVVLYDLSVRPYRKDSFNFTTEEFVELGKLKFDLIGAHDLEVGKDDIARCAFKLLVTDYRTHGAQSLLVQALKRKRGK